ncbi:hypothetical protein [Mycolicibacterium pulveris]|uniref:hypothetical protein n=1 Tax=Mycolicibacterium pulveris TaxID=36813 RepID=UPI003CE87E86
MSYHPTPARHACHERGVVEFHVWPVENDIEIDGPPFWRRPVTGRTETDELIVRPETGPAITVGDYLDQVMPKELQHNHSARVHHRDLDGPISDAPNIRRRREVVSGEHSSDDGGR